MAAVEAGANHVPACAEATIWGGAPKKAYHDGPPIMAAIWIATPAREIAMARKTKRVCKFFISQRYQNDTRENAHFVTAEQLFSRKGFAE